MTCREFIDFIMSYHDGVLPAHVRAPFEHHLSLCPACERYLSHYRLTVSAGQAAFEPVDDDVPADVPRDLISAILASRRP